MTFGQIKTTIETNLLESYKNQNDFKKTLREFKHNVLKDKNLSKIYSVYEQLSTPKSLNESDAQEFLSEGLNLINKILPNLKLPKNYLSENRNNYEDIDTLVYTTKHNLSERVEAKKSILKVLMSEPQKVQESIKIPINSMVKIANQTLETYIQNMDESTKKLFLDVVKSDNVQLKEQFESLKENTLTKLNSILESETESEIKSKLNETIQKIKGEEFSQMNYVKLVSLENNL